MTTYNAESAEYDASKTCKGRMANPEEVARLVNTDALSVVNIVMPLVFIATGTGTMFGSGGNALAASFVISVVIVLICALFLKPLLYLLERMTAL